MSITTINNASVDISTIKDAATLNNIGRELFEAGDLDKAKDTFFLSIERDPDNSEAYNNLGVLYWASRQADESIKFLNTAIQIDPANEDARNNLKNILHATKIISRDSQPRKLHIGGREPHPDWEIFDAVPNTYVDHIGNAKDLSRFKDNTFDEIYASHILEHFDHQQEVSMVLIEWCRLLNPYGRLLLSVPDLSNLASIFLMKDLSIEDRFAVMRMIFGSHSDEYDYHMSGFNEEMISCYLQYAGFCNINRVENFNIFNDTSTGILNNIPISLNVAAYKDVVAHKAVQHHADRTLKQYSRMCGITINGDKNQ